MRLLLILPALWFVVTFFNTGCNSGLPPQKPQIFARRDSGAVGDTIIIQIYTLDPEDQMVTYWVEWGDTTVPQWSYFFQSGDTIERTHIYCTPDTYFIRVKARDIDRNESPWSDSFKMRITDTITPGS
ncbi:hypothetical protein HPY86_00660 [candidate division WOR-3 bacterium]|nr:hypothetical protein [candidate division WOR-3 bacterium]